MCRVLFFQLCQVNGRPELAVIYSPGFSDPSPLPVAIPSAAHDFTRFFRGGKKKSKYTTKLFPASYCTGISTQVFTNHFIFSSSQILFQIHSLSVIALIFPNFSALTTLLLNSLCCLQSMKKLHEIVRFSISSSLLPFLFHWIALQRCFTGNLSAGESQSQIFILVSRTMNCQRILVLVLLSLNFMCGISPSTQGRAFPPNKAALFFHLFCLWSSIPGKNISSAKLRIEIEPCQFKRNKWLMRADTVSLPAFLGIFCPGLCSVLAWAAGIERDPLAHVQGAGDLCVHLGTQFYTASKTQSQRFSAFCNCNSLF